MRLLIPRQTAAHLIDALTSAGRREIGGILMGEHVGPNTFRVLEITVQTNGGSFAAFWRLVEEILAPLREFFAATRHEYTRYNYIGEWHSHHSFELTPSIPDAATMHEMVNDDQFGAHFVALLLVKLVEQGGLAGSVTVYMPKRAPFNGMVVFE